MLFLRAKEGTRVQLLRACPRRNPTMPSGLVSAFNAERRSPTDLMVLSVSPHGENIYTPDFITVCCFSWPPNLIEIPLSEWAYFLRTSCRYLYPRGDFTEWKGILTYISGSVNQGLLSRIENLVAEKWDSGRPNQRPPSAHGWGTKEIGADRKTPGEKGSG